MTLEFKGTKPARRLLREWDEHGRDRVVTATKTGRDNWAVQLTHPDGQQWNYELNNAIDEEVGVYMADVMNGRKNEFIQARVNGDRPTRKIEPRLHESVDVPIAQVRSIRG